MWHDNFIHKRLDVRTRSENEQNILLFKSETLFRQYDDKNIEDTYKIPKNDKSYQSIYFISYT